MSTEAAEPSMEDSIAGAIEAETAPAAEPAPVDAAPQETEAQRTERVRDEAGRFAKAAKDAEKAPAEKPEPEKKPDAVAVLAQPIGTPAETPKPEAVRPPQSLTPLEREGFAKAPPEIQQAIVRREREAYVALQNAAKDRDLAQRFQQTVEPYMPLIRNGSGDPIRTVAGLLQTAQVLQTAPPQQKAQLVAEIVKMYGVDVGQLDAALAGQPAQGSAVPQFDRESLLREAEQRALARVQQQAQEAQRARVQADLAAFAEKHEFFEDVRDTMGRLMQAGLANDLESAYKDACARNPEISRVLAQREASKQAATGAQATQRAKAASASVKASPASSLAAVGASGDLESDIEAAWVAVGGGR